MKKAIRRGPVFDPFPVKSIVKVIIISRSAKPRAIVYLLAFFMSGGFRRSFNQDGLSDFNQSKQKI
jgi:hypothetical protein